MRWLWPIWSLYVEAVESHKNLKNEIPFTTYIQHTQIILAYNYEVDRSGCIFLLQ
jgi:hypothetical protein